MASNTNTYLLFLTDEARTLRDRCMRQLDTYEAPMIGGIPALDEYRIELTRWVNEYTRIVEPAADKLKEIMDRAIPAILDYVANNPDKNRRRMNGDAKMNNSRWEEFQEGSLKKRKELEEQYDNAPKRRVQATDGGTDGGSQESAE